ncbi:uncharacterized protein KY384_001856 [Bacidia gigantensis]|uniref:uncharacterized protein n=1 Tax=Bacidia gigantensis TaxID=2732470 RepID=UPI001D04AF05|nr:uncharacterized protein KY384_001856 [Bacidia gigantensis]KAG8533073.1 hypothetical protein KY384_001856 [Bacidia gigantensis]
MAKLPKTLLPQAFDSGRYSDLKIRCCGEEFNVHKVIVCMQSPVLAAAIDGKLKEASTNCIDIESFDAATVKHMLEYLYGKYDDARDAKYEQGPQASQEIDLTTNDEATPEPEENAILKHIRVNAIANYYAIPHLALFTRTEIQRLIDKQWSAEGFCDALIVAFRATSDADLHGIMTSAASTHIDELLQLDEFVALQNIGVGSSSIIQNMANKIRALETEKYFANPNFASTPATLQYDGAEDQDDAEDQDGAEDENPLGPGGFSRNRAMGSRLEFHPAYMLRGSV